MNITFFISHVDLSIVVYAQLLSVMCSEYVISLLDANRYEVSMRESLSF